MEVYWSKMGLQSPLYVQTMLKKEVEVLPPAVLTAHFSLNKDRISHQLRISSLGFHVLLFTSFNEKEVCR